MMRVELKAMLREAKLHAIRGEIDLAFEKVEEILEQLNEEIEGLKSLYADCLGKGGKRKN